MFAQRLICSWIGAFALAAGAFGQTYVQIELGKFTFPQSINEKGEIAGTYNDFAGNRHGFVRDPNGTITTFDPPGSLGTTDTTVRIWQVPSGREIMTLRGHSAMVHTICPLFRGQRCKPEQHQRNVRPSLG